VTRVQKERFSSQAEYDAVKDAFVITPELLSTLNAKSTLRILHPLPRVNELSHALDTDPRSAYFRQMKHGLHVRMAIIACLLGKA
jgi:aspartate carbamoyltransferase catalytic subunit